MSIKKLAIITALSSTLAACGGGGSGSSGEPEQESYVAGEFKSSIDTGLFYSLESTCCDTDYYFESEKAIVFGSSYLPDSDFKYAATLVHHALPDALRGFNMTHEEYINQSRPVNARARDLLYNYIRNALTSNTTLDGVRATLPVFAAAFEDMAFGDRTYQDVFDDIAADEGNYFPAFFAGNALDRLTRDDFVKVYNNVVAQEEMRLKDRGDSESMIAIIMEVNHNAVTAKKTYVCLDESAGGGNWGQGSRNGISFAPKSVFTKHSATQITVHELAHHLQGVVTGRASLPRWFTEGQASAFANMSIATGNSGYNPLNVTKSTNEYNEYAGGGDPYPDYAQAYMFIQNVFSKEDILSFMRDMKKQPDGGLFAYDDTDLGTFNYYFKKQLGPLYGNDGVFDIEWLTEHYPELH
jgi:hypothetical protein